MADLRIDDATTTSAVAALQTAASQLSPVVRAAQGLDAAATGENALATELEATDQALAKALSGLGTELTSFATWIAGAAAGLGGTDQKLAAAAK